MYILNKESIQLATNETIMNLLKENRKNNETIRKMFNAVLISFTIMILGILGTGIYFLNTFDVGVETQEVTVEGENAQYNDIDTKGDNNNISIGGSK